MLCCFKYHSTDTSRLFGHFFKYSLSFFVCEHGGNILVCQQILLQMITSENIILETQFKNLFLWKSYVPFLRYSICYILNHSIYIKNCDVMISTGFLGWVHFWIADHLVVKIGQLIDIIISNVLSKIFAWFCGLGSKSRPFLDYQPVAICQKRIMMSC